MDECDLRTFRTSIWQDVDFVDVLAEEAQNVPMQVGQVDNQAELLPLLVKPDDINPFKNLNTRRMVGVCVGLPVWSGMVSF